MVESSVSDHRHGARRTLRGRGRAVREELGYAAELAALIGFAIVQPILGPFGESPETFVAVDTSARQIVIFAMLVAVVPVVVLGVLGAATRMIGLGVRSVVQTVLVAGLAAIIGVVLSRQAGAGETMRLLAAVALAAVAAVAHRRWTPARLFLRYASPTPVLLVAAFLLASPVAPLVRPPSVTVADSEGGDHPPVVVIVLDELPTLSLVDGAGGIDGELFPNIARLADTSTWYRNHTAVAPLTTQAMPAIVTGQLPDPCVGRPPLHFEHPDNLFTLLGGTHEIHGTEWTTRLCPESLCSRDTPDIDPEAAALFSGEVGTGPNALARALDEARSLWWEQAWPPATERGAFALAGVRTPQELARPGLEFLSGLEPPTGDRLVFDYLHLPVPHSPWHLIPADGYVDRPGGAVGLGFLGAGLESVGWTDDDVGEQLARAARSRHLLQLQWTDRLLGSIFDRLEALERWDDAVVVLTADHGIGFTSGEPTRGLTPGNQVEVTWVPLFVKAPGQAQGAVVDDNVLAVDVAPTVAEFAGVTPTWELDGRSLVGGPPRTGTLKPVYTASPETFPTRLDGGLVALEADGLGAITSAPRIGGDAEDLRVWRYGRNGALLGQDVDELGQCGPGPAVDYEPPESWESYTAGTLDRGEEPLPLWHQGTVDADESVDVAAAVDGVIAGWSVTVPAEDQRFDIQLAEPLTRDATGDPVLYQVVPGDGCRLRPLAR
ncbi:hypothetical protein BH20ACT3_BH20ACT3_16790 [soil metagenome]